MTVCLSTARWRRGYGGSWGWVPPCCSACSGRWRPGSTAGRCRSAGRAPALHGLDTPRLRAAARRLDEARLTAQELLVDIHLRCGRHHEVIGELLDLVTAHPWRERAAGQLMLALYRAGRRPEALEAFDRTKRRR